MRGYFYSALIHALWLAASIISTTALGIGFRRKCLSALPTFFTYLGFLALQTLIGIVMIVLVFVSPRTVPLYEWIQFALALANFSLEAAVIYELWNKVLLSRSSVANKFRPLPSWGGAALLLAATVIAAMLPQNVSGHSLQIYSTLSVSFSLLDIGLLLFLLLVSRMLGIPWGILPAGVALGILIGDAGDAARSALLNQMGLYYFMDVIGQGSSLLASIVWITCVVRSTRLAVSQDKYLETSGYEIVASKHLSEVLAELD